MTTLTALRSAQFNHPLDRNKLVPMGPWQRQGGWQGQIGATGIISLHCWGFLNLQSMEASSTFRAEARMQIQQARAKARAKAGA